MTKSNPFLALTTAAMALPAFAATQPVESTISITAASYKEEDTPARHVLIGSDNRYDIDIRHFKLVAPIGEKWSIGIGVVHETMSGASPWYNILGADQEASLIMSGATIQDSRNEIRLSATHYQEDSSITLDLSQSDEDDYKATSVSVLGEWDLNNKLSTLSLGASYSSDEIKPADAPNFGRILSDEKRTRSLTFGWGQVLNRLSSLHAGLSITEHHGYLSDPYKFRDSRPDDRLEWALSLKYRRYFDNQNAALHLDYRYYHDDWGINSHTLYSAWYKRFGSNFKIAPNVRYYSQAEADFYTLTNNFSLPLTTHQSSDFRISGYGAYTFGVKVIYDTPGWNVSFAIDRYISSEDYGHAGSDKEHPASLSFVLASIGLDFRF